MTFESEGLYIVAILHMVAAGELCCLSDNSGYQLYCLEISKNCLGP